MKMRLGLAFFSMVLMGQGCSMDLSRTDGVCPAGMTTLSGGEYFNYNCHAKHGETEYCQPSEMDFAANCTIESAENAGANLNALVDAGETSMDNAQSLFSDRSVGTALAEQKSAAPMQSSSASDGGVLEKSAPNINQGSTAPALPVFANTGESPKLQSTGSGSGASVAGMKKPAASEAIAKSGGSLKVISGLSGAGTGYETASGPQGAPMKFGNSVDGIDANSGDKVSAAGFSRTGASVAGEAIDESIEVYLSRTGPLDLFERASMKYSKWGKALVTEKWKTSFNQQKK